MLRDFCEKVNNVLDRSQINRIISHNFVARDLADLKSCVGVLDGVTRGVLFNWLYLPPASEPPDRVVSQFLTIHAFVCHPDLPEPALKVFAPLVLFELAGLLSVYRKFLPLIFRDRLQHSYLFRGFRRRFNRPVIAAHSVEQFFILIHDAIPVVVAANAKLCAVTIRLHQRAVA